MIWSRLAGHLGVDPASFRGRSGVVDAGSIRADPGSIRGRQVKRNKYFKAGVSGNLFERILGRELDPPVVPKGDEFAGDDAHAALSDADELGGGEDVIIARVLDVFQRVKLSNDRKLSKQQLGKVLRVLDSEKFSEDRGASRWDHHRTEVERSAEGVRGLCAASPKLRSGACTHATPRRAWRLTTRRWPVSRPSTRRSAPPLPHLRSDGQAPRRRRWSRLRFFGVAWPSPPAAGVVGASASVVEHAPRLARRRRRLGGDSVADTPGPAPMCMDVFMPSEVCMERCPDVGLAPRIGAMLVTDIAGNGCVLEGESGVGWCLLCRSSEPELESCPKIVARAGVRGPSSHRPAESGQLGSRGPELTIGRIWADLADCRRWPDFGHNWFKLWPEA